MPRLISATTLSLREIERTGLNLALLSVVMASIYTVLTPAACNSDFKVALSAALSGWEGARLGPAE